MGYFDILNKDLNEYLCLNYSGDVEIQAILDSYKEGDLLEVVDQEILYEFMEDQGWYGTLTEEELEELLVDSENYINYFTDCSLGEVYGFYGGVDIKTILLQTDLYRYDDTYYLVWDI